MGRCPIELNTWYHVEYIANPWSASVTIDDDGSASVNTDGFSANQLSIGISGTKGPNEPNELFIDNLRVSE